MNIRNIAVIAHVDHGKTTLIDGMLKQTNVFRHNQAEMDQRAILDQDQLEKEKGITILAKNTAVTYQDYKINIIDTPGHVDFGGEVERVINMADGALLIIDAAEGVQPQTKFVLEQAIKEKLQMMVVINKIDRKFARPEEVLAETEDLFLQLADTEEQLDFPVLYTVGLHGKAWTDLPEDVSQPADLKPLLDQIIETVPAPEADPDRPFKMLVSNLEFDDYKGTYAVGKIRQGSIKPGQSVKVLLGDDEVKRARIQEVFVSQGLEKKQVELGRAGDIVSLTGIEDVKIGQTLTSPEIEEGFEPIELTEPTLKILIAPNTSPLSGREGEFVTARQLQNRLEREKRTNIGLRIEDNPHGPGFMVSGRGQLHLSVLIENMRREGYEMEVGQPEVIYKEVDGQTYEPYEELTIEIDQDYMGVITEEFGRRKGELKNSQTESNGKMRMVYHIATKNLLGFRSQLLTKTRGHGAFNTQFLGYFPLSKAANQLRNGALVATERGQATKYAMENAQDRGQLFIQPGTEVYEGMIIGLSNRPEDININICKTKQLTNFRSNAEVEVVLDEPLDMTLEKSLDFIETDELLEVTPQNLRLRKKILDTSTRIKQERRQEK
jgi:GTP-binding protein